MGAGMRPSRPETRAARPHADPGTGQSSGSSLPPPRARGEAACPPPRALGDPARSSGRWVTPCVQLGMLGTTLVVTSSSGTPSL